MKIRQGFVSNSSSTSFTISYKEDVSKEIKCSACGRTNPNIMDFIEKVYNSHSSDTEVNWEEPSGKISNLKREIGEHIRSNSLLSQDLLTEGITPDEIDTINLHTKWNNEYITEKQKEIDTIKKEVAQGKQVISLDISYHDAQLNEEVEFLKKSGTITILQEDKL